MQYKMCAKLLYAISTFFVNTFLLTLWRVSKGLYLSNVLKARLLRFDMYITSGALRLPALDASQEKSANGFPSEFYFMKQTV